MKINSKSILSVLGAAIAIVALAFIISPVNRSESIKASPKASHTLISPVSGVIEVGKVQNITWKTTGTSASKVSVRIIRKIADNPARYELVREITPSKSNNGVATWVPTRGDAGANLSVEIGCVLTSNACEASKPSAKLAVVNNSKYRNTASVFDSIEKANNK